MPNLTKRVARTVGKHFVTLSCIQHPHGNSPAKELVFSGFVIDVSGEWFYVSAGHILRNIRIAVQSGSSFERWRLDDQTAGNRFRGEAIPYDFVEGDWLVLEDERAGLDYAAVHLRGYYRRQLEAGGVKAIGRNAWSDHVTEFDHWVLMGIPSESVAYDGETVITGRVVMLPLVPADEPVLAGEKANNQFYARPADGSEKFFKDADGMSGGPVFTLKKVGEQWLYGAIGVQSGWYREDRVLTICPFSSFGIALEGVVAEARAIQAQRSDDSDTTHV
ncbi:MAG: hypothetical protein KF834_10255 [Burkholderiales bacterium]|nr:hypothetical protein [Burkholderiales bacterium]